MSEFKGVGLTRVDCTCDRKVIDYIKYTRTDYSMCTNRVSVYN